MHFQLLSFDFKLLNSQNNLKFRIITLVIFSLKNNQNILEFYIITFVIKYHQIKQKRQK